MDFLQTELEGYLESLSEEIIQENPDLSEEELLEKIDQAIQNSIPGITDELRSELRETRAEMLETKRVEDTEFKKRNYEKWKESFDLLEELIVICVEAGDYFNQNIRPKAEKENDLVFDSVIRLHARACQISKETISLLKNGFSDGAQARWRALHEVVCIALFIKKHGQEAAQRYYDHEIVQTFKGMRQHQKFADRLNVDPFTENEFQANKREYDKIIEKYGDKFKGNYGWAAPFVNNKYTNFSDIERDVELNHMRPYYKFASQNIHGNVKGLWDKLGLGKKKPQILLAGQSDAGMGIPTHSTAISLSQITTGALSLSPNLDRVVILNIINEIVDEIGESLKNN